MVIMASGIARERVPTTTATESANMAAIIQITAWQRHAALVCCVLLWYWTSMLWSIDICQNKVSADPYYVTISRAQVIAHGGHMCIFLRWPSAGFFIGFRAHAWLTCWKQSRIVQKGVNANPGLKIKVELSFSSMQMFFAAFLCV